MTSLPFMVAVAFAGVAMVTSFPVGINHLMLETSEPAKCCQTGKSTYRITEAFGSKRDGEVVTVLQNGFAYYDFTDEKVGKVMLNADVLDLESGNTEKVEFWQFGVDQYTYNPATKTCVKTVVNSPLLSCVPPTAKYNGEHSIGGGSQSLRINQWQLSMAPYVDLTWSFTKDSCILTQTSGRYLQGVVPNLLHVSYYDYQPEVKDPNVFDLPEECK